MTGSVPETLRRTPVPYAIYDSRRPGAPRVFCEDACADRPVLTSGSDLLKRLFEMA